VILLTHWGDLSSWEYAQQLRHALPALKEKVNPFLFFEHMRQLRYALQVLKTS